jgi:AraC family transcriptional regulator
MDSDFYIRSFIGTSAGDWQDPGFHEHPTLEISLIMEGKGAFEWVERKQALEAGNVVIVPASLLHSFEGIGKNRFGVIHLQGMTPKITQLLKGLLDGGKPTVFTLSRLDKDRFERLFREWLRVMSSPLKQKSWNNTAWAEVMILFLLEHSQKDKQYITITKAADYIRENLQEGVQISDLAALVGLTETWFRRLFEEIYQMSPKQYQQQCRMTEAKWLLSSSNKDIREIADLIGFTRLHSFSQWFKQIEGISPSEWRKMQQMNFGKHS